MHGVEKSRVRAREARKMHLCTARRVFAHAHHKLEFDDAERSSGRSDDNRTQNKIALAVELSLSINVNLV